MNFVAGLKSEIEHRIWLVSSGLVDTDDQLVLVRSLLEEWAIVNFVSGSVTRLELFKCYNAFEWRSHVIFRQPGSRSGKRQRYFKLLEILFKRYPHGFRKYYRLIKKRAIGQLKKFAKPKSYQFKRRFRCLTSVKVADCSDQFHLVADYMAHHLITKLPFPYRIVFGRSITFFVLKYTSVSKNDYWLLADLSHGIILGNDRDSAVLRRLVVNIIDRIRTNLALNSSLK